MDQEHLAAARHLITFARDIEYNDTRYAPSGVNEAAAALEAYIDSAAVLPMDALTIVIEAVTEGGYQYDVYAGTPVEIDSGDVVSLDGGLCTTTLENALGMVASQAAEIIKKANA
ncbi:hypothetical protein [Brevundimonas sp.]|uniref:hypothetical protein n=1 Tax=Brevundimonas sp. TaxID=1871086 RepID=UPI003AF7BBD4